MWQLIIFYSALYHNIQIISKTAESRRRKAIGPEDGSQLQKYYAVRNGWYFLYIQSLFARYCVLKSDKYMKKNYSILFHFLLFILLAMFLSIPAFADHKTYIFNKNNRCVINNVTMSRKEISSNKYDLYMNKGNKKAIISSAYDGEDIISDGDAIYFCETRYNKKWIFELNIRKETVTRLKALSDEKQNIRILDNYKSKIYYVKNHLDLYSYNFKNGNIKRELHNKHVILWKRK